MREINRVAVIGAGVIGASFALLFAKNGLEVNLYDISKDALDAGINNIHLQMRYIQVPHRDS